MEKNNGTKEENVRAPKGRGGFYATLAENGARSFRRIGIGWGHDGRLYILSSFFYLDILAKLLQLCRRPEGRRNLIRSNLRRLPKHPEILSPIRYNGREPPAFPPPDLRKESTVWASFQAIPPSGSEDMTQSARNTSRAFLTGSLGGYPSDPWEGPGGRSGEEVCLRVSAGSLLI